MWPVAESVQIGPLDNIRQGFGASFSSVPHKLCIHGLADVGSLPQAVDSYWVHDFTSVHYEELWTCLLKWLTTVPSLTR